MVNHTKSDIGHAMGAAGALELAGNLPSFDDGLVHPTINVDELDPACAGVDHVLGEAREARVGLALSNSFGFGGHNAVLALQAA